MRAGLRGADQCFGPLSEKGTPETLAPIQSAYDEASSVRAFPAWSPRDRDFDIFVPSQILPAIGPTGTVWTPIVQFRIPDNCEATLLWWGHDCADSNAFTDCQWRVRVNDDVRAQYPAGAQLADILPGNFCPVYVCGTSGQIFALDGLNNSVATPFTVQGRIKGLYRNEPRRTRGK